VAERKERVVALQQLCGRRSLSEERYVAQVAERKERVVALQQLCGR